MRKIVLSAFATVLIAASASQVLAAQQHHPARKSMHATTSEQFRNARNTVEQRPQPSWPYSGWSAPAGR
ncbi:hypothetical protein [Bradyrhizobium cajani]|uniref:DUF680 domain-containing protein n=1 Tax=Bradyrhizobium cajani TaxID=1928661 RepID=A0A844TDL0_9BRAD|nr:hypothetical protein [Bradyrhizobium cajani]MCP3374546.1 hypothetical protein [Bradyrhizobium cajani]MVT77123.1 hypothetical protein [Bradyrhizobium cajani]